MGARAGQGRRHWHDPRCPREQPRRANDPAAVGGQDGTIGWDGTPELARARKTEPREGGHGEGQRHAFDRRAVSIIMGKDRIGDEGPPMSEQLEGETCPCGEG